MEPKNSTGISGGYDFLLNFFSQRKQLKKERYCERKGHDWQSVRPLRWGGECLSICSRCGCKGATYVYYSPPEEWLDKWADSVAYSQRYSSNPTYVEMKNE